MTESLATTAGRAGLGQTWTDVHTVGPDLTKVNLDSFLHTEPQDYRAPGDHHQCQKPQHNAYLQP